MNLTPKQMIQISLFAALTAIGAFIKIPTPVIPFTLQFVFCAYAGIILGARNGLYSQLLYLFIGLIGVPIFAYGGGITYIFMPTFGYLIGFAACAYIIGKLTENLKQITLPKVLLPVLLGLISVYFFGVVYLFIIKNFYSSEPITLKTAIVVGALRDIPADIILGILVSLSAMKIIPALRKAKLIKDVA